MSAGTIESYGDTPVALSPTTSKKTRMTGAACADDMTGPRSLHQRIGRERIAPERILEHREQLCAHGAQRRLDQLRLRREVVHDGSVAHPETFPHGGEREATKAVVERLGHRGIQDVLTIVFVAHRRQPRQAQTPWFVAYAPVSTTTLPYEVRSPRR